MKLQNRVLASVALLFIHAVLCGWTVRPGHPRLFVDSSSIPMLRTRIATTHRANWNLVRGYAERRCRETVAEVAADASIDSNLLALSFVCMVEGPTAE